MSETDEEFDARIARRRASEVEADTSGLDVAEIVQAIYNADLPSWELPMTIEKARAEVVEAAKLALAPWNSCDRSRIYFDYVGGRAFKMDLSGPVVRCRAGGVVERAIAEVRGRLAPHATPTSK